MTIVAIWTEDDCRTLFAVADTRITSIKVGPSVRLSDSASKLLSIPYACRQLSSEPGFERHPFFSGSFGFAYAGNSLAAQLTASTSTTLFTMLVALDAKLPPKLCEIAQSVSKIAEHFCRESMAAHNGDMAGIFDGVVFGHCPWSEQGEVYRLRPSLDSSRFGMTCDPIPLTEANTCIAIGSGRERFNDEVARLSANHFSRLPQRALQNIVDQDKLDLGGYVSMGISYPFDFKPYWYEERHELSGSWRSYNGIDIDELGFVGACKIGGTGMARAGS